MGIYYAREVETEEGTEVVLTRMGAFKSSAEVTSRWTYPENWVAEPAMPTYQKTYAVYKIYPDQSLVGMYCYAVNTKDKVFIDWGDGGEAELLPRGSVSHEYDYNSLPSQILPEEGNPKTVLVSIEAEISGNLGYVQFSRNNGKNYNNLVFMKSNCIGWNSFSRTFGVTTNNSNDYAAWALEAVEVKNLPTNVSFSSAFANCMSLRTLDTNGEWISATSYNNWMAGLNNVDGEIRLSLANAGKYTGTGTYIAGTSFDSVAFKDGNPDGYFGGSAWLSNTFYATILDLAEVTLPVTVQTAFLFVSGANIIEELITPLSIYQTATTLNFSSMRLLKYVTFVDDMTDILTTISFNQTSIESSVLNHIINKLKDRTGMDPGTLTIGTTPAAVTLTDAQVAAAAAKNWTLTA